MRFLLFANIALFLFAGCSPKIAPTVSRNPDFQFWQPHLRDSVQINRYRIAMSRDNMNISGIWLVRYMDETWRGTMVNEFGLKMFDFTCTARTCKLINVVALIDRWHIRRTIARDVQFMLEIDNPTFKAGQRADRTLNNGALTISHKNKLLQRFANDEMVMQNKRHNLTYSFNKMDE